MSMNLQNGSRPTVVLVHGAFAESASWNGVIRRLQDQGYTAIAAANPLRSVSGDARLLASILDSIEGPVVERGSFRDSRKGEGRRISLLHARR